MAAHARMSRKKPSTSRARHRTGLLFFREVHATVTMTIPTLTTERLILRPLVAADSPALAAMNADPDVARFISLNGQPLSAEGSWRQLAMPSVRTSTASNRASGARGRCESLNHCDCPDTPGPAFSYGWTMTRR
jgi:hypothetical protein